MELMPLAPENHVVVELKRFDYSQSDERDFEEPRGYRRQIGYRHGVYVRSEEPHGGP